MDLNEEIIDYLELIDNQYSKAKDKGLSRMSVEWGIWSTKMNREILKKIKDKHPLKEELHRVYYCWHGVYDYWVVKSQLLELHYKSRFFKLITKSRLNKECEKIKELILGLGGN